MLNFIYYPVSFILWVWHEVFSFAFGDTGWAGGIAWALSVMFLVFTLRAILFKPFVSQIRSMRRMQEFQPEMAKIRKKYANDRQKQAEEMQRLQKEHGVNPIAGCLPMIVQIPVFIGLFHVLREFGPTNGDGSPRTQNYFFGQDGVDSFNNASLFGAKLGAWVTQGEAALNAQGTSIQQMLIVMIPLMLAAGIFTHITARHSVARQVASGAGMENPQTAIMQKLMLYVFPIGVVVGAPFLPLAILIYWVANNLWTLGQQWIVYRKIDAEQAEKKEQTAATRQSLAPRPGQKPVRQDPTTPPPEPKTPGAKPITRKPGTGSPPNRAAGNGAAASAAKDSASGNGATGNSPKDSATGNGAKGGGTAPKASGGGGARPTTRRPRKRR